MYVELWFGDSAVMVADEFPEMGVSPLSFGGTATVLHISTDDVEGLWRRVTEAEAEALQPLGVWGIATDRCEIRSGIAGGWHSASARSRRRRSSGRPPRPSVASSPVRARRVL